MMGAFRKGCIGAPHSSSAPAAPSETLCPFQLAVGGSLSMNLFHLDWRLTAAATGMVLLASFASAQSQKTAAQSFPHELVEGGQSSFQQNCAFCHGRDAGGGETGPDLTRSKLVSEDVGGNKIGPVIRNGRPEKGMPRFSLSDHEIEGLVAFIHNQKTQADSQQGGRRGVDVEDLQSGDAQAGKQYFNGAGKCSSCHSPTGDLAGIAQRYQGLKLEERMLYPQGAPAKVSMTLPSGQTVTGKLAYRDEFTIGLRDSSGWYRSWPVRDVKYTVDAPAEAHAEQLAKYTDADIHNLMAYLQTLR
jgi:cytochrome c oxidase cbb3-type subunit III